MRHADARDSGIAEEAIDRRDDVGGDMLQHGCMRAADRQVQRSARLLSGGEADHRGLGDIGEPVADDFAPAADDRRLDEAEFAKGGPADFGNHIGDRARLAAARPLIAARRRLFGALLRARFRGLVAVAGACFRHRRRHAIGGG